MTEDFLKSGKYEVEVVGVRYATDMYLDSPFDPGHKRLRGIYD